jgi:NADH dehydrogenase
VGRPRVVIVGGGFAGLAAARALGRAPVDVTLIDRANHHLFQPLLYQVATAVLAPTDITSPIRHLLRGQQNTTVWLGHVQAVDPDRRLVVLDPPARPVPYDFLILAAGARHSYFGHPEWEALAPGLKTIADAREIRRRFLTAFEEAERCDDEAARDARLRFVVVGGGPTGVELAGILPEVARHALAPEFRRVDARRARVILLEGGPRILPSFPPDLSERARADLEALGVEVRTGAAVTRIEPEAVYLGDERVPARTVFWAAGNTAAPVAQSLGAPLDRAGRVLVAPDLSVPGRPEIFVAGDLAAVAEAGGRPVPGVAPAAQQAGAAAAANVLRALAGRPRRAFHYRDRGNLATIGRHRAVADFGRVRMSGYLAWFLWLFVHILYLAGFRNRLSVLVEWGYAYFTYQRGARLIAD